MTDDSPVPGYVSAALAGDPVAWDHLVQRYLPLVLSVARRHRLAEEDAEDVVQTVWLRLVEHLGDLREPRALPGWIVTTTRNECLRVLRGRRRTEPFDPLARTDVPGPADEPAVEDDLLDAERHEALLGAMAELPDRQRELLLLLVEDPPVPYEEISRRLGMPVGSIGPSRARALRRVRESPAMRTLLDAALPES